METTRGTWLNILVYFLIANPCLFAQFGGHSRSLYEKHLDSVRLDSVDLSLLEQEAKSRALGSADLELDQLLTKNFRHIFMNRLNRSRFIIPPKPQTVANSIVNILDLNQELIDLIEEGNRMHQFNQSSLHKKQLIGRVKKTSRDLHDLFRTFFVEVKPSTYSMVLPSQGSEDVLFRYYLRQSGQISRELTQSLDDYFFNVSPVAVSLDEYRTFSISVLCESLARLSDRYSRILTRAKH